MGDSFKDFGETAKGLAKNPLGIIALFIVLVYGFASLVTAFSSSFTATERLPLIYFLIIFPVLVLGVFGWLVSCHSKKLYGPSDYKNEENYVRMQIEAAVSLGAAAARRSDDNAPASPTDVQEIVEIVREAGPTKRDDGEAWRRRILWVDDRPDNNIHERKAFEALGLSFVLAESTAQGLAAVRREKFAAIISDMGRREGPREGYALLDALRKEGISAPFFIYAGSRAPEHVKETLAHGGNGCTNHAQELFQMVTKAVLTGPRKATWQP